MPDATVRDALASHADDATVVRELHDVPPYRVFEVRLDGRRAVLKVDAHPRGHAAVGGSVRAYVARETPVPVPAVLAVGEDHFLAAWDDDAPEPDAAEAIGERWACARLDYHRSYLADRGHADVVDAVDALLAEHPEAFEGAGPPVLCHGNVHSEHAATRDGRVVSVVDFEHALVAPAEYDYWRLAFTQFHLQGTAPEEGPASSADWFRERVFDLLGEVCTRLE